MDTITQGYDLLISRLVVWAKSEENLKAVVILGSRARVDHPADQWSDLDILLIADDMHTYIDHDEWVAQIGAFWLTFVEPTGDRQTLERRVLYAGGLDVDFAVLPVVAVQHLLEPGQAADTLDVFRRGARVLVDKDGWAESLISAARELSPPAQPPAVAEFLNLVNDFWYHTVWTAKHLRRGELWWAKIGCDDHLKYLLRQMLEWQARATHGERHDTWLRGRFLEEWADPRALAQLPRAFAHYDSDDVWRALLVTMDIFRLASTETAESLHFTYPTAGSNHAIELVRQMVERESLLPDSDQTLSDPNRSGATMHSIKP